MKRVRRSIELLIFAIVVLGSIGVLNASDIPSGWKRFGDKGKNPKIVNNMLELSGVGSGIIWDVSVVMNKNYKVSVEATGTGGNIQGTVLLKGSYNNR